MGLCACSTFGISLPLALAPPHLVHRCPSTLSIIKHEGACCVRVSVGFGGFDSQDHRFLLYLMPLALLSCRPGLMVFINLVSGCLVLPCLCFWFVCVRWTEPCTLALLYPSALVALLVYKVVRACGVWVWVWAGSCVRSCTTHHEPLSTMGIGKALHGCLVGWGVD